VLQQALSLSGILTVAAPTTSSNVTATLNNGVSILLVTGTGVIALGGTLIISLPPTPQDGQLLSVAATGALLNSVPLSYASGSTLGAPTLLLAAGAVPVGTGLPCFTLAFSAALNAWVRIA
jgi:hypothetical protein